MNLNPLAMLPAKVRAAIYLGFILAGIALGALQVWFDPDPWWLTRALKVLGYLTVALGLTAVSNLSKPTTPATSVTEVDPAARGDAENA
jgi:hypothetical protein